MGKKYKISPESLPVAHINQEYQQIIKISGGKVIDKYAELETNIPENLALPLSLLMTWMDIILYKSKVFQSTKENILSIYELTSMQVVMLKLTRHIALLSKIKNYRRVGK